MWTHPHIFQNVGMPVRRWSKNKALLRHSRQVSYSLLIALTLSCSFLPCVPMPHLLVEFPAQSYLLGRYGCIGRPLALLIIRTTLAKLLLAFDVGFALGDTGEGFEAKSKEHFTLKPGELNIAFRKRWVREKWEGRPNWTAFLEEHRKFQAARTIFVNTLLVSNTNVISRSKPYKYPYKIQGTLPQGTIEIGNLVSKFVVQDCCPGLLSRIRKIKFFSFPCPPFLSRGRDQAYCRKTINDSLKNTFRLKRDWKALNGKARRLRYTLWKNIY